MAQCMNMAGMGWMMAIGGIFWLLLLALVVLGIAALIKYLRSERHTRQGT